MKNYFTLLVIWKDEENYTPEFGDFKRSVVEQEFKDTYREVTTHHKIISTPAVGGLGNFQQTIQTAVDKINAERVESKPFTIHSLNREAKKSGLKLYAGHGYYYWNILKEYKDAEGITNVRTDSWMNATDTPDSVYVYRFSHPSREFWMKELQDAILQMNGVTK